MAKCEVISCGKVFKPVTLQITLESQDELHALHFIMGDMSSNGYNMPVLNSVVATILEKVKWCMNNG